LFSPIETIRAGVSRFGAGELNHRIRIGRRDELGELAASINAMAEQIQQMLEAKRQLLLAISHELRSPLTRARVNAELLPEDRHRQRIIRDLKAMEQQIAELLETERLHSRHAKLDLRACAPAQLLQEVIEQAFSHDAFELQDEQPDLYLRLDPARMRLLIRNLLDNALRHTPASAPAPLIHNRLEGDDWMLSVTDQGPGIDAEHLPRLTEPFYRVDHSRQRDTGGYGLGLYLCRVIAEAHGGRLSVTSRPGKGTTVTLTLPLQTAAS
jgi:signal transduction histidine kinase